MRLAAATFAIVLLTAPEAQATPIIEAPEPVIAAPFLDVAPTPGTARERLLPLIRAEASRLGVPPDLADAVAIVETNYTPDAVGSSGEIGLMQVMPGTAALLGLGGDKAQLFDPAVNIHYGVSYLARAWAQSGGDACRALMKYRAGTGEEGFSPLSIAYCQRAAAWLRGHNDALADNVTRNTPAAPTLADPNVITLAGRRPTRIDTAALAEIAGIPGMVVERLPVAAWHIAHGRIRPDLRAIEAAARTGDADLHEIHVPEASP